MKQDAGILDTLRDPELNSVYHATTDVSRVPRELVVVREWESLNAKAELARMHRDGHCLEAVMWYVHHFPDSTKEVIRDRASLLPRRFATISRWRNNMRRRSLAQADTLSCTQPLVPTSLRCVFLDRQ